MSRRHGRRIVSSFCVLRAAGELCVTDGKTTIYIKVGALYEGDYKDPTVSILCENISMAGSVQALSTTTS